MKNICPNCEKETKIELIRAKESLEIRGERVEVDAEYFKCLECGEDFESTRGYDALEAAYREYRRRHGLLQPEEIRDWRKGYGLTQKELSQLLGWGDVTLSRYESRALQAEAHDKVLRLVMEPHNLLTLVRETPEALGHEKYQRLIAELSAVEAESCSFERVFEERFGRYAPDEFSGYKKLDLVKLFNAILFFCKDGQLKTKLNKLLFYADFKHFKEYTVSIVGANYVHLPYGPVPDNYEFYFAELINKGDLEIEEVQIGQYLGEKYMTLAKPDLSVFGDTELKVMATIKEYFEPFSATEIRDFSHKELAYKETTKGEKISYKFAEYLQI